MSELLPLYGICFVLAYICNKTSVYDYGNERYIYKNRIWFLALSLYAIFFAGLRTNYNDTAAYINIYNDISLENGFFNGFDWTYVNHPGFYLICRVQKALHLSAQSFLMFFSAFSIGVQFWFIRKYSNNTGLAAVLFLTIGCFTFSMAAIKQCTATAICLIALDRLIQKKNLSFYFLVLLSTLFHPFSIVFIVCPLLRFKPWTQRSYVLILIGVIAGITLQIWLGNALNLVSIMGIEYDEKRLLGEGVNLFRVAVLWSPVILSFFLKGYLADSKDDQIQNLMINLMTLNAVIMFIAIFGNPIHIGRLANFFLVFQVIGLTYLLQSFKRESRGLVIVIIIVLYFAYSYYGNAINGHFDSYYSSISLMDYLKHVIE